MSVARLETQARRIRALLDENEELRDRVEQLEAAMVAEVSGPVLDGLTRSESVVLGLLLRRDIVSRDQMHAVLYAGRDDVGQKIFDVFVCKLRRKLAPLGIEVETVWGIGWRIAKGREIAAAKRRGESVA